MSFHSYVYYLNCHNGVYRDQGSAAIDGKSISIAIAVAISVDGDGDSRFPSLSIDRKFKAHRSPSIDLMSIFRGTIGGILGSWKTKFLYQPLGDGATVLQGAQRGNTTHRARPGVCKVALSSCAFRDLELSPVGLNYGVEDLPEYMYRELAVYCRERKVPSTCLYMQVYPQTAMARGTKR
jgi:hypothetical protein